jgi:hypothetical protein
MEILEYFANWDSAVGAILTMLLAIPLWMSKEIGFNATSAHSQSSFYDGVIWCLILLVLLGFFELVIFAVASVLVQLL